MTFSVGLFRTAMLLLAGLMLGGCLPSAPGDDEKEPYFLAGENHVNAMDYKGAIESFEKAVEVNPKSASAHFELGWLFDQKEPDPAAAIYHYERYLELQPNSDKVDMIKTRILACKQQLAQTVFLGAVTEKQQREFEVLAEENKRLRDDLERWRAYALRLQALTNQPGPGQPVPRGVPIPTSGQAAPADSTSTSRPPTIHATTRTHTVKAGETATAIARKYGVKVEALLAANPRVNPRRLQVGQALLIPAP